MLLGMTAKSCCACAGGGDDCPYDTGFSFEFGAGFGFLASLLLMQAMGVILEATGGLSFESFRIAWALQYVVWAVAVVGILITRRKARRLLRLQDDRSLLEGIEK